jgi:hypothetical protein
MFARGVVFIKLVELKCTHKVKQNKLATLASVSSTTTMMKKTTSIDKELIMLVEREALKDLSERP